MVNSDLTLYHKTFDEVEKIEVWEKHYYKNVWWFGGKGTSLNKGYENANDVDVRIWYGLNDNLNINDISRGDILVQGELDDIETQQDLVGYDVYNVTSINNNTFGSSPHIHLGGK